METNGARNEVRRHEIVTFPTSSEVICCIGGGQVGAIIKRSHVCVILLWIVILASC